MEIKIDYGGSLDAFPDAKSTDDIRNAVKEIDGVESVDVKHIERLSVEIPTTTEMVINYTSLGVGIASLIYALYTNRKNKNKQINISVNNQIVNISNNDSLEQVQLKLQIGDQNK